MEPVSLDILPAPVRSYLELNLGTPDHYIHLRDVVEPLRRKEFRRVRWGIRLKSHYRKATERVRAETFAGGETTSRALRQMRAVKPAEAPCLDLRKLELEVHVEHIQGFLGIGGEDLSASIRYMKQIMFL